MGHDGQDAPPLGVGRRPRVLLCSVFKPFNVPSPYNAPGNLNELGLFHRSFTRRQGMFSFLHQVLNYPLHLIAENLPAQTTVLEYPTLAAFAAEVNRGDYDYMAVGCVTSTLNKARRMCQIVKERSPRTVTILGGPGAMAVGEFMEPFADHTCAGDGVEFMRRLLGASPDDPIRHPLMPLFAGPSLHMGLPLRDHNIPVAVGLGCPNQCEFCSTSHQFKGRYVPLFRSADDLFSFMRRVEEREVRAGKRLGFLSFQIYDENFLLNRDFVMRFRELNREQLLRGTPYLLFIFSDARALASYTIEELMEAGVDTIWVGLESPSLNRYDKIKGIDLEKLLSNLASAGFKVIGSLIAGLEAHTEALIHEDIELTLKLPTIAVQYMPVNPLPGTAFYDRMKAAGLVAPRDPSYFSMSHYNLLHPTLDETTVLRLITRYYDREHHEKGPLTLRFLEGRWAGIRRFQDHPSPYVQARLRGYARDLMRGLPAMLLGEELAPTPEISERFRALRKEVTEHFGTVPVWRDLVAGRLDKDDAGYYLACTAPLLGRGLRQGLAAHALLKDPRNRGWSQLLFDREAMVRVTRQGTIPWDQPETLRTEYNPPL